MTSLDRLLQEIHEEFPHFTLMGKARKEVPWWLRWVFRVVVLYNKDFYSHYATVVGSTVYLPTIPLNDDDLVTLLRHERVHMRDAQKWGPLFYLSYLFVLPFGITLRSYWEWRAYQQTILCWSETPEGVQQRDITWLVNLFTGPAYFWMNPFRGLMHTKILNFLHLVREGRVGGPDYPHGGPKI